MNEDIAMAMGIDPPEPVEEFWEADGMLIARDYIETCRVQRREGINDDCAGYVSLQMASGKEHHIKVDNLAEFLLWVQYG